MIQHLYLYLKTYDYSKVVKCESLINFSDISQGHFGYILYESQIEGLIKRDTAQHFTHVCRKRWRRNLSLTPGSVMCISRVYCQHLKKTLSKTQNLQDNNVTVTIICKLFAPKQTSSTDDSQSGLHSALTLLYTLTVY